MIKVVFVEENPDMARLMVSLLEMYGYEVFIVKDNSEVWMTYKLKKPDVIFLQVGVNGQSGYSVLHTIRERDSKILIVLISRSMVSSEAVAALFKGANNYINWNYTPEIILAYLTALMRTANREEEFKSVYMLTEEIYLDSMAYCLYFRDSKIILNYQECTLLKHLVLNKERVVDKERLILEFWPEVTIDTNTYLAKVIMKLRRILCGVTSVSIETIRGKGYMLMVNDKDMPVK